MPKNEPVKVVETVEHKNLFFLLAIFAVLLAGDLVWWQIRQTGDDYDFQSATISSVIIKHSEEKDLSHLTAQLDDLNSQYESLMNSVTAQLNAQ